MSDPYENAPEGLDLCVQRYVRMAGKLKIPPSLLAKYARILIAAEEVVADRERSEQSGRDETARVAAAEHGIYENNPQKAKKAYKAARQAQQQVHNSARGLAKRLVSFETLLEARYKLLQVDVVDQFPLPDTVAAIKLLTDFAEATVPHPHNLAELKIAKSELSLTVAGHALLWWRTQVPRYKGQWEDMYALARCWHLTDAKDIDTFRRTVRKLKTTNSVQGRTYILGCPPWALG